MGQLGETLPKALIEIGGRTLLDRSLETLRKIGVSRIVVVVGHLGEQIVPHGFDVVRQEKQLGLAHAIATAKPDDDFVVLCPDNIYTDDTDLIRARQVFESNEAVFLLVATVTPNTQRDRKSYFTSARRNLAPNVYDYRGEHGGSGLAINSTGCTFFKREALEFLPSFTDTEHIFRDYLDAILEQRDGLIYLLRGMRYDFSGPEDIEEYLKLKTQLNATQGPQGVSAILINPLGQVLLQQRDDNPAIRYPGHWSLFGGTIEDGESPADATAREVLEEIDFNMRNFGLFREFVQNNKREFAFAGDLSASLDELTLSEGKGMNLFYPAQLKDLQLRPDDKATLEKYFGG